jgi:hypothetical protein
MRDTDDADDLGSWPRRCACGACHSKEQWRRLALVGIDREARLELRNCTCGSTLAMPLTEP